MGKYEYNKQEIPEYLKYQNDDSESSEISGFKKSIMSKKEDQMLKQNNEINANNTTRNLAATNPMKRQNSGQSSNRISVRGSGKLRKPKENTENMPIYSKTKSKKIYNDDISETKSKKSKKSNNNDNNYINNSNHKYSAQKSLKKDSNKKEHKNNQQQEKEN